MHRLARAPAPTALAAYRPGQRWEDMAPADKAAINQALTAMQRERCAYCERCATLHIEHFRCRKASPQHTFSWENLLGSCSAKEHCGHHKDGRGRPYDIGQLLDPTVDDPERFLIFVYDGNVRPRAGLAPADERRACETIRVLNLNHPALVRRAGRLRGDPPSQRRDGDGSSTVKPHLHQRRAGLQRGHPGRGHGTCSLGLCPHLHRRRRRRGGGVSGRQHLRRRLGGRYLWLYARRVRRRRHL